VKAASLHTGLLCLPSSILEEFIQGSAFLIGEANLDIFLDILLLVKLSVVDISGQSVLHRVSVVEKLSWPLFCNNM
jgi:hypothetical protein